MRRDQTFAEMKAEIKMDFDEMATKLLLACFGHPTTSRNDDGTFAHTWSAEPAADIIDVEARDVPDRLALPQEVE
jgi:hypothetical protein